MRPFSARANVHNTTLTRIPGILVGHDTDSTAATGCTVVLTPQGAVAAVDVRGGAPGTRETDVLRPENLVTEIHGLVLAGGSAFGLAAADGVMRWLFERGAGFETGSVRVPIVPAAVLYDLVAGRSVVWPDAASGHRACEAASADPVPEGRVGAGAGATVAKLYGLQSARSGGLGSTALALPGGGWVAALVVVNALGEIVDPADGRTVVAAKPGGRSDYVPFPGRNTSIGVVATDLALTKTQCLRVAQMAHDGLARAIRPSHTLYDGDTLFALSLGRDAPGNPQTIGVFAAEAVSQAVLRAVSASVRSIRRSDP